MVSARPSGLSSPRLSNQGPACRIGTTFRNARAGSLVAAECASREEHVVNTGGIRAHHGPVCFDSFALDFDGRQLTRDGEALHVTPKAFDLLVLLVSHAPRVVSKDELQERLWKDTVISDATIVGVIKELRRVLDDKSRDRWAAELQRLTSQ